MFDHFTFNFQHIKTLQEQKFPIDHISNPQSIPPIQTFGYLIKLLNKSFFKKFSVLFSIPLPSGRPETVISSRALPENWMKKTFVFSPILAIFAEFRIFFCLHYKEKQRFMSLLSGITEGLNDLDIFFSFFAKISR